MSITDGIGYLPFLSEGERDVTFAVNGALTAEMLAGKLTPNQYVNVEGLFLEIRT